MLGFWRCWSHLFIATEDAVPSLSVCACVTTAELLYFDESSNRRETTQQHILTAMLLLLWRK